MRIVIAGVLGGLVLFFWGFVSHMFLPLGEMGHEMPKNEDAVLAVLKENLGEEGYYFIPGISAEQYEDPGLYECRWAKDLTGRPARRDALIRSMESFLKTFKKGRKT